MLQNSPSKHTPPPPPSPVPGIGKSRKAEDLVFAESPLSAASLRTAAVLPGGKGVAGVFPPLTRFECAMPERMDEAARNKDKDSSERPPCSRMQLPLPFLLTATTFTDTPLK
ncbi:hypothetical protein CDAR_376241 [Caerostris darwini]|uniref:Uncharacterized protein n=1 Tax=Caerostris darwini TaxID=1538125 RepID=A0AAV4QK21_9ARAC|nr:hypothetical protein CDAR_376241 [Caerostris darwini]